MRFTTAALFNIITCFVASLASAQTTPTNTPVLVNTYFVGTIITEIQGGVGIFALPPGSMITGDFSFDSATIGAPYISSPGYNLWLQSNPTTQGPNTIPAGNSGLISAYGPDGTAFAASSLQDMILSVSEERLDWGGYLPDAYHPDANYATVDISCPNDPNPTLPFTIPTAFPLSIPSACRGTIYLTDTYGGHMVINVVSLGGPPVDCPTTTWSPAPSPDGRYIQASVTPSSGTITSLASVCGYDELDWQQKITHKVPSMYPKPLYPEFVPLNIMGPPSCLYGANWYTACAVFAGNGAPPLFDPVPGGDQNSAIAQNPTEADSYPFYYPIEEWSNFANYCTSVSRTATCSTLVTIPHFKYVIDDNGRTMNFGDGANNGSYSGCPPSSTPQNGCDDLIHHVNTHGPTNRYATFSTYLMGVTSQQIAGSLPCGNSSGLPSQIDSLLYCTILHTFSWNTTFNGFACSVAPNAQNQCVGGVTILGQDGGFFPLIPGSGTGGVTITAIDGVQLPPSVLGSDLTVTASGLAYSRVSQTFNGTVTLKNTSTTTMVGPLQVLMLGLPPTVVLLNQSSNLSGTPYLTVPIADGLAPGASVSVPLQFKNPANATINLQPTVYAGTIQ